MYIFYLLFMIMIPFKTQYVYMCFSRMVRFLTLSHIFYQDSSIYDFNHILFYTMSGIFILLPTFLLKHDVDFL